VVFVLYFLGGTVPLVALGVVIERYQLTAMVDQYATMQLVGTVVAFAMLSLGCFVLLRRVAKNAMAQMEDSNHRLLSLLNASRGLSAAHHGNDASESVVHHAIALTHARAACVFLQPKGGESLKMTASTGVGGVDAYEALIEPLIDLVDLVMSEGIPAVRNPESEGAKPGGFSLQAAVVVPLPGEKAPLGALAVIHTDPGRSFSPAEVDVISTLAGLASVAMINAELRFAQRNFFSHITDILVTSIDIHLDYHGGHGRRVAHLANRLGRRLQLDDVRLERLHFAALLHDIGMLKIDRSGPLNAKTCEKHQVLGYRMLIGIRLWDEVAPLILYHHERFDGKGYPEGISGEAIPLEARIIALCEAFDSMTSLTSYQPPVPIDQAVKEIEAGAGTQFDPAVVEAFLQILKDG
jgi:HD-GYP domain-containing protein (c-di-GMP phosphodiesterase class II)